MHDTGTQEYLKLIDMASELDVATQMPTESYLKTVKLIKKHLKDPGIFVTKGIVKALRNAHWYLLTNAEKSDCFSMNPKEYRAAREWLKQHHGECTLGYTGAIGGGLHYIFSPTSLGCGIKIECDCGASVDVTDVESW